MGMIILFFICIFYLYRCRERFDYCNLLTSKYNSSSFIYKGWESETLNKNDIIIHTTLSFAQSSISKPCNLSGVRFCLMKFASFSSRSLFRRSTVYPVRSIMSSSQISVFNSIYSSFWPFKRSLLSKNERWP